MDMAATAASCLLYTSIIASAVITAIGGVVQTKNDIPTKEETRANADRIGYKIFISALMLALVSRCV